MCVLEKETLHHPLKDHGSPGLYGLCPHPIASGKPSLEHAEPVDRLACTRPKRPKRKHSLGSSRLGTGHHSSPVISAPTIRTSSIEGSRIWILSPHHKSPLLICLSPICCPDLLLQ
ncbi:unnamed protein product [Caenorhabditis brenneri]